MEDDTSPEISGARTLAVVAISVSENGLYYEISGEKLPTEIIGKILMKVGALLVGPD